MVEACGCECCELPLSPFRVLRRKVMVLSNSSSFVLLAICGKALFSPYFLVVFGFYSP